MDSQMFAELVQLCERLPALTNYEQQQSAYRVIQEFVQRPGNLAGVMSLASASQTCLFVTVQMLTKHIIKIESQPPKESDDLNQDEDSNLSLYQQIISQMLPFITAEQLPQFVINSCINLVSICLKYCLMPVSQLQLFEQFLTNYFPQFEFNVLFLNCLDSQVVIVQPANNFIPTSFTNRVSILISLIENISLSTTYSSYYDYRKNMYTFKNNYLAVILQLTVWYLKVLTERTVQPPENNPQLKKYLKTLLRLFEIIVSFPYTLHLQQYECDEEIRQSSIGEIYFTSYFRNVTEDASVLQCLTRIYRWYNSCIEFDQFRIQIIDVLKITAKLSSANSYFFDTEIQRIRFRQRASEAVVTMIQTYRSYDEVYTCTLLELPFRMLHSYAIRDYDRFLNRLLMGSVVLCQNIVKGCPIKLENLEMNPTCKAMDILYLVYNECKSEQARQLLNFSPLEVKTVLQEVLQEFLNRICSEIEAKRMMEFKFKNYEREVDTFEEMFKPAVTIFKLDARTNFRRAAQLKLQQLSIESLTLWTHFFASLISETPDEDFDVEHATATIGLLNFLQFRQGISILRLISVVVNKVLAKVSIQGRVISNFWQQLQRVTQGDLSPFIQTIIQRYTTRLNESSEKVEYSLEVLSVMYNQLKKSKVSNLESYSEILRNILNNLEKGIFSRPEFYKRRTKLYEIIFSLWVDNFNLQNIYNIYSYVRQSISNQMSLTEFLKYMYDMTGLIGPIESFLSYKILLELFIRDMKSLEVPYFTHKVKEFVDDATVKKAFIRFTQALVADTCRRLTYDTHSSIGLQLETILRPAVEQCLKTGVSKRLLQLLRNFMKLCPIRYAIPIPFYKPEEIGSVEAEFNELLGSYFDNIHRVEDLQTLFPYIKDNVEWLTVWYEEAMNRNLSLKNSKSCIQASIQGRIWKNNREKEIIARMLLALGTFDPTLMLFPQMFDGNPDQTIFVKRFNEYFK